MNTPHISIELVNHKANVDAWAETPDELSKLCSVLLFGLATRASDPAAWIMHVAMKATAHLAALHLAALKEDTNHEA